MSKQKEIREGIAELFKIARQEGVLRKWADGKSDADEVLALEDRLGIVLKVDRELPSNPVVINSDDSAMHHWTYQIAQQDMLKDGYVAVEPLIEERE